MRSSSGLLRKRERLADERAEKFRSKEKDDAKPETEAAAKLTLEANKSSEALATRNLRIYATQAVSEITERLNTILGTIKISLDPLGDHKLSELSKATDGLNSDLNDVLAKITSFVSSTGIESKEHMVILDLLVNDVIVAKMLI